MPITPPGAGFAADQRLLDAAGRNYAAAFRMVARHADTAVAGSRQFGEIPAVATGLGPAFYNAVVALAPSVDGGDVSAALAWLRGLGLKASVHVRSDLVDAGLSLRLVGLGLAPDPWSDPCMALEPLLPPPAPPADLRVAAIDETTLDDWHRAFASGFGSASDEAIAEVRRSFPVALIRDPDSQLIGGFVGEQVVGTSWAVRDGDTLGIYAVGIHASHRARGYGTAMTWAAVAAGRAWGCRVATLQASEMGLGVYARMGFRTVGSYTIWLPSTATAQ